MFATKFCFIVGPNFAARQHVLSGDGATFGVFDPVVSHLLFVPAVADSEYEPSVGYQIKRCALFREPEWVSLSDQRDTCPQHQVLGHCSRGG